MVKKVLKGRQRHKQVVIKQVRYSVAPSGLSFVVAIVPGVAPPSVVFRTFGANSPNSDIKVYPSQMSIRGSVEREPMLRGA